MLILDKDNRNKAWMANNYFRYDSKRSGNNESIYCYAFPVWRSGDFITLEARITVTLETGIVETDVYDVGFRGKYAPYYLKPAYYEPLLQEINNKIERKLKEFNIHESESGDSEISKEEADRHPRADNSN